MGLIKHLTIIASLMTVELSFTESKDDDTHIRSTFERHYPRSLFTNVCEITDKRSKIHCYCDNSTPGAAVWADCWVLSAGLSEDDPVWASFTSQPAIAHLSFNVRSEGALTFIPAKAVVRLDNVEYLTIQFGTIDTVPPFAFTNSSSIRRIILESNEISTLEVNAFAKLAMLTNLSLDDNQISELKRGVFTELPSLRRLFASNNNISLIHEKCFENLNALVELRLDFNVISVVTREMFEGLENLVKLDLRNNKLTMLGNLAFSDLWRLKELNLDNNAIEFISERSFGGLSLLRELTLSGNKLVAFYEDIIEYLQSLEVLDLSENLLETISYETIRSLIERERTTGVLYIHGNPLVCDCRLSWVYSTRNDTKSLALRETLDKVTCIIQDDSKLIENSGVDKVIELNSVEKEVDIKNSEDFEYYEEKLKPNMVALLDVPLNVLPCRKEYIQTMEEDGHPVQNEIRLKAFSKATVMSRTSVVIVLLVIFM